jgi:hypothetical protein
MFNYYFFPARYTGEIEAEVPLYHELNMTAQELRPSFSEGNPRFTGEFQDKIGEFIVQGRRHKCA